MTTNSLVKSPLGKKSAYTSNYQPSLLFPISRKDKRDEIGVPDVLPFRGVDYWNAYEISWLNLKGKPQLAIGEFFVPCESLFLIESKSLKLYLNSFNQTQFSGMDEVQEVITHDLSQIAGSPVKVNLYDHADFVGQQFQDFSGVCLDGLDIEVNTYEVDPSLLRCSERMVEEKLYSHLLKSNCLVTGQPDWGSVFIHYEGPQIKHEALLKYIISFRQHNEFHEQCIERIFMDLTRECHLTKLTVYGKYTRRGGLDINPFRSNVEATPQTFRTPRQ